MDRYVLLANDDNVDSKAISTILGIYDTVEEAESVMRLYVGLDRTRRVEMVRIRDNLSISELSHEKLLENTNKRRSLHQSILEKTGYRLIYNEKNIIKPKNNSNKDMYDKFIDYNFEEAAAHLLEHGIWERYDLTEEGRLIMEEFIFSKAKAEDIWSQDDDYTHMKGTMHGKRKVEKESPSKKTIFISGLRICGHANVLSSILIGKTFDPNREKTDYYTLKDSGIFILEGDFQNYKPRNLGLLDIENGIPKLIITKERIQEFLKYESNLQKNINP